MPIVFDAPVTPTALTTFTREVPIPANLAFSSLFPTQYVNDNKVNFAEVVKTNRTARFRPFDGRIHVSDRDTLGEKVVRLLPLSTSSPFIGELERLQMEFARTGGGGRGDLLDRAIYNDGERLTNEVLNRMELAWGDVLTDGRLTINEGGYHGEADFGVPANHLVAPSTLWSNRASATVLSDLVAWNDIYVATNGVPAGAIRTSLAQQRNMQSNVEIINAVAGSAAGRSRVSAAELGDLLAAEGLPPLATITDGQFDVDGVATRVLPPDRVLFTPADMGQLGSTVYGVSATALELVNAAQTDFSFEEAPGVVGVVIKEGPPFREFTFVDAVGMPILSNPRALLVADVA